MKDWVTGEEVNCTYDALSRLLTADTTGAGWGQAQGILALNYVPDMMQPFATIPTGTAYSIGTIAPHFGQVGGGV